jgi:beta-galactosidase
LSDDGKEWQTPVAKGRFDRDADVETVRFEKSTKARYLKFVVLSEQNRRAFATIAELELIEAKDAAAKALN